MRVCTAMAMLPAPQHTSSALFGNTDANVLKVPVTCVVLHHLRQERGALGCWKIHIVWELRAVILYLHVCFDTGMVWRPGRLCGTGCARGQAPLQSTTGRSS